MNTEPKKKSPKYIKCSDCQKQIPANIDKNKLLQDVLSIDDKISSRCVNECQHPLCQDCIKKTSSRFCYDIGVCDQCMWWKIT